MKSFTYKLALGLCFLLLTLAHIVHAQGRPDLVWMRGAHHAAVRSVFYSPDGKYFVSSDGLIKLWRLTDKMLLRTLGSGSIVALSADGQMVAGTDGGTIQFWRVPDGTLLHTLSNFSSSILSIAFAPNGQYVAVGLSDNTVQLWNLANGTLLQTLKGNTSGVISVAFSADGQRLASCGGRLAVVWQMSDGTRLNSFTVIDTPFMIGSTFWQKVLLSPQGDLLYAYDNSGFGGGYNPAISVWGVSNPALNRRLDASAQQVSAMALSVDGSKLAIGGGGGTGSRFVIWQTSDFSQIYFGTFNPNSPDYSILQLAFSANGNMLALGQASGVIPFIDISSGQVVDQLTPPGTAGGTPSALAVSPNGQFFASAGVQYNNIVIRRASDGAVLQHINTDATALAFTPDSTLVAGTLNYNKFALWRVSDGTQVGVFDPNSFQTDGMALSPDGRLLAGSSQAGVSVWRISDGKLLTTLRDVGFVAFSSDGKTLAIGGGSYIRLWRVSDWTLLRQFDTPINSQDYILSFRFSPDGQSIAAASWRTQDGLGEIDVWNVQSGGLLNALDSHGPATSVAFSPDGGMLASGDASARLNLWSLPDGRLLSYYDQETYVPGNYYQGGVRSVAFSPEGKFLYYGNGDGTVCAALNPYRNAVFPNHGGNTGNVTVKIVTEPNFPIVNDTTVKLTADGQPDIMPISTTVDTNTNYVMSATFALNGAPLGKRDVVITLPSGETRAYPQSFTIEQGVAPNLTTQVVGRSQIRGGAWTTYSVLVQNTGNVDASNAEVRIQFPKYFDWILASGEPQDVFMGENSTSIGVQTDTVRAGSSQVVCLRVKAPVNPKYAHQPFQLSAWANVGKSGIVYFGDLTERRIIRTISETGDTVDYLGNVEGGRVTGLNQYVVNSSNGTVTTVTLNQHLQPTSMTNSQGTMINMNWFSAGQATGTVSVFGYSQTATFQVNKTNRTYVNVPRAPGPSVPFDHELACEWMKFILKQIELLAAIPEEYEACLAIDAAIGLTFPGLIPALPAIQVLCVVAMLELDPKPDDLMDLFCEAVAQLNGQTITSGDPNDITGAMGFDSAQWVAGSQPLPDTVYFGNVPTATAPAAEVIVTDHLDATKLDMTTVNLQSITFANQTVTPTQDVSLPVGMRQFNADVDLRPAKNLIVRINANVDMLTGDLMWHFTSLDPVTMQPPTDPTAGFLDPGQEGSVLFSVLPRKDLKTGTVVTDQASIMFDFNAWIDTPVWFNTIDNDMPSSQVNALAGTQNTLSFPVSWKGTDVGSGLKDFTIYVSDNGGAWTPWLTNTTDTSTTFTGVGGHTYAFYSQARDNASNLEATHLQPDTTTIVAQSTAADVSNQVQVTLGGFRLNRTTGRFVQTVTLTNTGNAITGPISLVMDSLSSNAGLFNSAGATSATSPAGSPYLNILGSDMAAGASLTITVEFTNPTKGAITYTTRVLAGPGNR
jgi:WD40 repeat protein